MFIFSICLSWFLAESLMRHFYKPIAIFNLDETAVRTGKYAYTPLKNGMGFREADLSSEIFQDNYRRILFLGDSFTHGDGVEKGEDRFSDIIEKRLNLESKTNSLKYHIYNAGVSGTNPYDWLKYLRELVPVYQPQYVYAIFFLRDGTNIDTSLLFHKKNINRLRAKYENKLWYKYTYIGKYIGDKQAERDFSNYYMKKMFDSYLGNDSEKRPWIRRQNNLLTIRNLCKKKGIEFHLVIFPLIFGLETDYKFYDVEKEIARFAKVNGIPVFSLINGFIGQNSQELWVSPNDQHPNEKGHLIAANTLYPYLKKMFKNSETAGLK